MSRILLAEDDRALGSLLAEALSSEGYTVVQASTAVQARGLVREGPWHLCLVDTLDPTALDGPGDQLRSLLAGLAFHAPVVLLTAHRWAQRVEAAELGIAAIIAKPFDLDDLLGLVERTRRR